MIYWPVILFAVAAVGGATLAIRKFTGKRNASFPGGSSWNFCGSRSYRFSRKCLH